MTKGPSGSACPNSAEWLDAVRDADVRIRACRGLCSFYAEKGGLLVGFEADEA